MSDNVNRMSKEEIRCLYLKRRENVLEQDKQELARKFYDNFFNNVTISEGSVVSGFFPIKGEIDIIPVMKELKKRGYICVMPRMIDKNTPLEFIEWYDGIEMTVDNYNIPVPVGGKKYIPDVVLTTFLVFDENRDRIGYGAGMYDRTIADIKEKNRPVFMIGVGYEFQKIDSIPTLDTDIVMDMVVTDENVYI